MKHPKQIKLSSILLVILWENHSLKLPQSASWGKSKSFKTERYTIFFFFFNLEFDLEEEKSKELSIETWSLD